uniref:ADP ribosylation factor like GTPase 16 n=1 Tax=Anas platyrhynchos platyrhynchos TaxID=8840 RepID=A0A493STN9_ANAPP
MAAGGRRGGGCLLLGAAGVGKSLLGKRLRQLSARDGAKELGEPPATLPTVGTNLTELPLPPRVTVRELGGCMGPIWPSYYGDCGAVMVRPGPGGARGCPGLPAPPPAPGRPHGAAPSLRSSWSMPPTPRRCPRPACSCWPCCPPRSSLPCPCWCSSTRCKRGRGGRGAPGAPPEGDAPGGRRLCGVAAGLCAPGPAVWVLGGGRTAGRWLTRSPLAAVTCPATCRWWRCSLCSACKTSCPALRSPSRCWRPARATAPGWPTSCSG